MRTFQAIVFVLAALSSLALTAVVLAQRKRGRLQWSFAFGMLGFALESVAAFAAARPATDASRLFWLVATHLSGLLLTIPWAVFLATLTARNERGRPMTGRLALAAGGLALSAAAIFLLKPFDTLFVGPGQAYAAHLSLPGRVAMAVQLVVIVGLLAGLEVTLRASRRDERWRIKYLVLGLGGIFLVRFYLLSQILLFQVVIPAYLAIAAVTLLLGNVVITVSLARDRFLTAELTVSRHLVYRSVVVGILGLYLFAAGALGYLLNHLGIPEDAFWGVLLLFVSGLGLATILLSENVRWRLKRFISLNFYRSKYDYREQWVRFTKRLGSLTNVDELGPQLLAAVGEAVGSLQSRLYLSDERDGQLRLTAAVGIGHSQATIERTSPLAARLAEQREPFALDGEDGTSGISFGDGSMAVPLRWHGTLTGLFVIGPERTGAPYTAEDSEFLATVGDQAAGALATARVSETLAQAREFEAFHRLTSFVIHDLKNCVAALSLLSQNAIEHFDDPEFQRDAVKTLSRSVDRMKALLARLSRPPDASPLRFQPIDLAALVLEAARPFPAGGRVGLVKDLAPVRSILGDPEALLRVLQNLITNAFEAISGDGQVTIKTYERDPWVVVEVGDTGCGIPEDFLRKSLFAPFRSTKKGGWGIGLYQARGIVEAHRGVIEVASCPGEGTTFWVKLSTID